jgi:hypothetical protein
VSISGWDRYLRSHGQLDIYDIGTEGGEDLAKTPKKTTLPGDSGKTDPNARTGSTVPSAPVINSSGSYKAPGGYKPSGNPIRGGS